MDLVVRTSHGEAEVTLRLDDESRTLGDVVGRVTGRSSPTTLSVDGRAVPSTEPLRTAGLLTGSVISTDEAEPTAAGAGVELEEIAGPGAGATAWLSAGRHAIGPGRRVSTAELDPAPVDEPVFEVEVGDDTTAELTVRSVPARLDGEQLEVGRAVAWQDGLLEVRGRVFRLGRQDPTPPARDPGHPGARGTVVFNRPPRPAAPPEPVPRGRSAAAAREQAAEERRRRRAAQTDPVEAIRTARRTGRRLWERRAGHPDAFQVPIGLADLPWEPRPAPASGTAPGPGRGTEPPAGSLPLVPVVIDLVRERWVGITGSDDFATATARGLMVAMATTHGPADLRIMVLSDPERAHAWEWIKWLPHARVGGPARLLLTRGDVTGWVSATLTEAERGATTPPYLTLVVVDEPAWWRDGSSPLRPLFTEESLPLRVVALARDADDAPSICTTVVSQQPDDRASVDRPAVPRRIDDVYPYTVSSGLALDVARSLAPLEDPDLTVRGTSTLPAGVSILDLLELPDPTASAVAERWERPDPPPVAKLGVTETGVMTLDLLDDGPHVVVAGTPGSGRSDLLRTAVASLAAASAPDDVGFVVVDTGRRFEELAELPHTLGRLTDLHRYGIARLLRCLRAELRHREHVLHSSGAPASVEVATAAPFPRLVVVVDELEVLVDRLPALTSGLVDLARRGPDLGLHLILATRRPASLLDGPLGTVDGARIALRLQEPGDSIAMIGSEEAALLPEHPPGRALARLGAHGPQPFRSADGVDDAGTSGAIDVRPFVVGRDLVPMEQRLERDLLGGRAGHGGPITGLGRLITAIRAAADASGRTAGRRPVPDPLPGHLPMREFFDQHPGDGVPFGLVDLPDEQRQAPAWWSPVGSDPAGGSRLVVGAAGSGTSSLLATLLLGVAERFSPDDVHLYGVVDDEFLAPLVTLPHVGAVVGPDDVDRVARLLRVLTRELERRSTMVERLGSTGSAIEREPAIVLAVDDLGSLGDALDGWRDLEPAWRQLEAIVRDGPMLGLVTLITARHERDVPPVLAARLPDRLVFELDDRTAYESFGFRPADVPEFVAGRAIRPTDRTELQVAAPPTPLDAAVGAIDAEPALERPPQRVDPLPASITVDELARSVEDTELGLLVPVGLDTRSADPAVLPLRFGEHVVVTGPARSGRSSLLVAIAAGLADADVTLFAVAPRGGPLAHLGGDIDTITEPADLGAWVQRIVATGGRRVVLVDDADRLEGPLLDPLVSLRSHDVTVILAGRNDDLRADDHWSRPLRRFRTGVLLGPSRGDGDLLHVSLGTRMSRFGAHTGLLVDDGELVPLLAAGGVPASPAEPSG